MNNQPTNKQKKKHTHKQTKKKGAGQWIWTSLAAGPESLPEAPLDRGAGRMHATRLLSFITAFAIFGWFVYLHLALCNKGFLENGSNDFDETWNISSRAKCKITCKNWEKSGLQNLRYRGFYPKIGPFPLKIEFGRTWTAQIGTDRAESGINRFVRMCRITWNQKNLKS